MTDETFEQLSYRLSELPLEPPDDPNELAARRLRRAQLRGRDAPQQTTDAKQFATAVAKTGSSFVPLTGFADAFGYMPDFEGGFEPSVYQNVKNGDYAAAGGQALGAAGDTLWAIPLLGATAGTALKELGAGLRATRVPRRTMRSKGTAPAEEVFATFETIPGILTNHLPSLHSAHDAARIEYSKHNPWAGPDGADAIYAQMPQAGGGRMMGGAPTLAWICHPTAAQRRIQRSSFDLGRRQVQTDGG